MTDAAIEAALERARRSQVDFVTVAEETLADDVIALATALQEARALLQPALEEIDDHQKTELKLRQHIQDLNADQEILERMTTEATDAERALLGIRDRPIVKSTRDIVHWLERERAALTTALQEARAALRAANERISELENSREPR